MRSTRSAKRDICFCKRKRSHVIKVEFNGEDRPYSAMGRYYLRTADEDREVSPAELKQFFVTSEYREKWEKTKSEMSSKQIDKKAIMIFCDKAVSVGRFLPGDVVNYSENIEFIKDKRTDCEGWKQ